MKGININQTIDKMVKDKFLAIFNSAQNRAEEIYNTTIASQLIEMSNFDKIKFLMSEQEKAKKLNDGVNLSAYVGSSTNEDWLLKLFSSRTTILNVDDSEDLDKAVFAGRLRQLIQDEFLEMRNRLPRYSFEDFAQGKEDKIFSELGYTWHLADSDDADKIRLWQSNKIFNILSHETGLIINGIQQRLSNNPDAIQILSLDIKKYQSQIKNKKFSNSKSLIRALETLSFLAAYNFELLKNENAVTDFHLFQEQDLSWNRITPSYLEKSRELLKASGNNKPFSESPIIFYSIDQVIRWMEKIVDGQSLVTPFSFPDYNSIADDILKKAEEDAENTIAKFDKENKIFDISPQEAEVHYIRILDIVRHEYNQLEDYEKQYFASILRENVNNIFSINALFFDFDGHKNALEKAANLYYRLTGFYFDCKHVTGSNRINFPNLDNGFDPSEINYLASTMVLDNDLHEKLTQTYNTALSDTMQYSLPIDLMMQNIKEQLHVIFIECVERLLAYLEDCEPVNKVLYIQSRLKDLRLRELQNKSLALQLNDKIENGYTSLFKEYLEIEADFITSTKDIYFIPALNVSKRPKAITTSKPLSFGFKQKDTVKLLDFITQLNLKIDLLNTHHTSPQDFVNVLTADIIDDKLPEIYFDCETTQLFYIFNKLKPYFSKLTFQNIEKSQLFITKNGTPLKAQNLSASKIENPKEQAEIDKAFSLLQ